MKNFFCILWAFFALTFLACNEKEEVSAQVQEAPSVSEDASAIFKTKVRRVEGDVGFLKGGKGDSWKKLRHGQNVVERDRIKTALESEAVLGANDGTVLSISENSDVEISADLLDSLRRKVSIHINRGNVYFDVQKQKTAVFEFRTGTAVSAIRGTAGFVGEIAGQTLTSLKEGRIEVTNANGQVEEVLQKQTLLVNAKGQIKKMNLKSSGTKALARTVDSLAASAEGASLEETQMQGAIQKFDDDYAARQKSFEEKMKFEAAPIADTIREPFVLLTSRATPGMIVSVHGDEDTVPPSGVYQKRVEWEHGAYGTKRFLASCSDGHVEVPCFMWVTEYVAEDAPEKQMEQEPQTDDVTSENKGEERSQNVAGNLNRLVVSLGKRLEKIHLDLPAKEYSSNMSVTLDGISENELSGIKSIRVLRKGEVVKTISGKDLNSLKYKIPVSIALNRIAEFDVVATLNNNKEIKAKKTYEVYCLRGNHMGKARNFVQYKTLEDEYEAIKKKGDLKKE